MRSTAEIWSEADGLHIDVRGLPPPQPMVQILQLLPTLAEGATLTVHHDRDPKLLYPELVQMGWWAERIDGEPGEVRLLVERTA